MTLPKILYVSRLPLSQTSGGGSGVNVQTYHQLQKYFDCTYIQVSNKASKLDVLWSKIRRKIFCLPGSFALYRKQNLQDVAEKVQQEVKKEKYDLVFFREFTPFIHTKPTLPYVAYNDVDFAQYFDNTFKHTSFFKKDINRIKQTEAQWLNNAACVFYESKWGMEKTKHHYDLLGNNLQYLGRGGNISMPIKDTYAGGKKLLFIANSFKQKGGDIALSAFSMIKINNPEFEFHVVGGKPDLTFFKTAGCYYHGFLNKKNTADLHKLTSLLADSFFLLHPTREDTNPLVITEAGYFGCPSVSVNRFAISELIPEKKLLLSYPARAEDLCNRITFYWENESAYLELRKQVWKQSRVFNWNDIGANLAGYLHDVIKNNEV